jgi:transcription antitermination factor NusG
MLKVSDNPPIRPPEVATIAALEGDWWVAHTKARSEKQLAWDLLAQKTPYLLPMIRKLSLWQGRRRYSLVPLFPSYVFFCGTDEARIGVLSTGRVCQVLPVRDRSQFVNELTAVERVLESKTPVEFYPFAAVGKRCRVAKGPLRGMEGIVVQVKGLARLVLQVSILGQSAALEIGVESLEPAE